MITFSIILFIVGLLVLIFGKLSQPIWDIIGILLVVVAYGILLIEVLI